MANVPGLRSPYEKVGGLVYFGRMLDKIRLHAAGRLPPEYRDNLGDGRPRLFDARCCVYLGISYQDLVGRTLTGGSDEEILQWACERGTARTETDLNVWNQFMMKLGWRDDRSDLVRQRMRESRLEDKPIDTMFDYLDYDEGRDPAATKPWLQ